MLGEKEHYDPADYQQVCSSGLEKDWIIDWFGEISQEAGFSLSSVDICRGDALPSIDQVDCVILGGTMHVVSEEKPWLKTLDAWLPNYRVSGKPLLGICGGHQFIATQMEDGELEYRHDGILAGTYDIELTDLGQTHSLFNSLENPRFNFGNFLHVLPSPEQQSRVLACINDSRAICIDHGGDWYTTQFHPETRKPVWSCMHVTSEPENLAKYSDDQDGAMFIRNFLSIATDGS